MARGFSFTEVLFAVMILGVGFIMIAAIFPVAIQQAKTSSEETTGAAVSRGAATYISKIATDSVMPATDNVVVGPDFDGFPPQKKTDVDYRDGFTMALALRGSLVVPGDSRYAFFPFYRRAGYHGDKTTWSPFAQVIMIPVLARNQSEFVNGGPLVGATALTSPVPGIARIIGSIVNGLNGAPDVVTFQSDFDIPSAGAYLIVADSRTFSNSTWDQRVAPQINGRIYRLGNPVAPADPSRLPTQWELMPGFDFDPIRIDADNNPATGTDPVTGARDGKEFVVAKLDNVSFFVVGRALTPNDKNASREGAAQDIAAYTTFVNVK